MLTLRAGASRNVATFCYRIVSRGFGSFMQAICLIVVAKSVGVSSFGALSVGLAAAAIVGNVFGFGSSGRALRLAREDRSDSTATSMFLARAASGAVSGCVAAVIEVLLSQGWQIGVAVAIIVFSDQTCELEQAILAGKQRQLASANWVIIQRLLPLLAIIVGTHAGLQAIESYGMGSLFVAAGVVVRPIRQWVKPVPIVQLIRHSKGFWFASIVGSLGSFDLVVARAFGGSFVAGIYSAANRATNPISIFVAELLMVLTPASSAAPTAEQRNKILRSAMKIAIGAGTLVSLASPLLTGIIIWLLGQAYASASPIITGFIIAAAVSGVSQTIQARLYTEGRPVVSALAVGCGTIIGLVALGTMSGFYGLRFLWAVPIVMQAVILILMGVGVKRAVGTLWP